MSVRLFGFHLGVLIFLAQIEHIPVKLLHFVNKHNAESTKIGLIKIRSLKIKIGLVYLKGRAPKICIY